ncbi:stimulator of interferon genes protein isoform X2 [Halyomorpha halys]|uniref:stimulator of interferon genes protein isoform X2 n=1 Tax=Halyomorpha halys TaxID=286706 RepID=UPI0006D504EF|nr:stimulator of interferon genes protein-like isoform X2 [Halyomorpha halys]
MNLLTANMSALTTDYGSEYFISMMVLAVISGMLFLVSLIRCWIDFRNSLQEVKPLSYIDGYSTSMVCTYFYGYLKKIIPDEGTGTGGLYDKILYYKERQRLTDKDFPLHKIFIIICASGFIPPTLEKIDNKRIEARKHLDELVLNDAGINGRHYTTAVYKIKYRNLKDHITVAMEGTPPLLTLSDASGGDPVLKKYKKLIIEQFYKKLSKKLAENVEFANSYEVIFYNDDPDKPPTLADEIILRHIDKGLVTNEALEYPFSTDSVNETSKLV